MYSNNSNRSRAAWARGFAAWAMLVVGLGLMARPAEAAPFAYVANDASFSAGTVSVIDTATNMVVATVTVGVAPGGVAVTPDGKHVYVADAGRFWYSRNVWVIDTATNTVVATVPMGNNAPISVAVTPDGKHVYVTNFADTTVLAIDTASNTVVATVPVGKIPLEVAITPDGKHAYVTTSNNVSVIDTASNTVVATVRVRGFSRGVAITPDGKHAYVTSIESYTSISGRVNRYGFFSVIDTATNKVVATVPVRDNPNWIAITPDGKHAYVTTNTEEYGPGSLLVIDTASNTVVATVPVEGLSKGVAITPDGKHAYVTLYDLLRVGIVSVIDTATNTVVATVSVGNIPNGLGIVPQMAGSIPSQRRSRSKPAPSHHHPTRLLQQAQ